MNRSAEQVRIEWLVLRCQSGDAFALAELVTIFQPRLVKHACYLCRPDEAAALDAVQESWLAIVRGINRIEDPATFRAWAYRIVTNKCADRIRSIVREREAMDRRPPIASHDATEDSVVLDAMVKVGPDQRAILSLRYLEDMSTREIAAVLEVPEGTVKSRLHQARNELKQILERSEL
jgi:RNA polymerase sigma-70 factor (ECF subfamily)